MRDLAQTQNILYAYFGHHKCASTWIWKILHQVCRETGLRHTLVVNPLTPAGSGKLTDYRSEVDPEKLGDLIQERGTDFLFDITAAPDHLASLPPFRGFHVIRDPRDICVSGYFSHLYSHPVDDLPHLAAHREQLRKADKDDGLFLEIEFAGEQLREMCEWDYQRDDILEAKMEDLTANPYSTFLKIFDYLGLLDPSDSFPMSKRLRYFARSTANRAAQSYRSFQRLRVPMQISGESLLGRVYDNRFSKKTGNRKSGSEDVKSHYRKGTAGDWRNHLTEEHVAYFKQHHNDLLLKLGYENDADWSLTDVSKTTDIIAE